jgi:hypothetical protein
VRKLEVRYRRRRKDDGAIDKFVLKTSSRDVLTVGTTEPEPLEAALLRERAAGDGYAYYRQQRLIAADRGVEFQTKSEQGLLLDCGALVQVYDPGNALPAGGETHEVVELEEVGDLITARTAFWQSAIYGYVAGTLPTEPATEDSPDYSATPPAAATGFTATFGAAVVQNDGHRVWPVSLAWTNPRGANFRDVTVEFRIDGTTPWELLGETTGSAFLASGKFDDNTAYQFRVVTRNAFKVQGPETITTATTTVPGTPANVSGVTATAAGHRQRKFDWPPVTADTGGGKINLDAYEWQWRTASGGGGTLVQSGETKASQKTITESGLLQSSTSRWFRVRARTKSGQTSASWAEAQAVASNRIEGAYSGGAADLNTSTVATGDVGPNQMTDPYSGSTSSFSIPNGTGAMSNSNDAVAVTANLNGGVVLITVSFQLVGLSGWNGFANLYYNLTRDSTAIQGPSTGDIIHHGVGANGVIQCTVVHVDTGGGSGSKTYRLRLQQDAGASTANAINVRMAVVEFKR